MYYGFVLDGPDECSETKEFKKPQEAHSWMMTRARVLKHEFYRIVISPTNDYNCPIEIMPGRYSRYEES